MKLRALDLFCGAGGLTRGLIDAGFEIVGAVDSWGVAVKSYRTTFPKHPILLADVASLRPGWLDEQASSGPIDLVAGGPPCQGFSIQRIGENLDDRNDMVFQFGRVVRALQPRAFLMENVPGLLGRRGRATFAKFLQLMATGGYHVLHETLDAAGYGVPQHRRRVFVVGLLEGRVPFAFPAPSSNFLTVGQTIGDLREPPTDFSGDEDDTLHRRMKLSDLNLRRLRLIPPGGGFEDLPTDMRVDCHKGGAAKIGHRAVYGRLRADRPAATITARFDSFTRGRFAHPSAHRNISLREGARLQGFPDTHAFLGTQEEIAAQIGNAIPPPMAKAMGLAIARHLTTRYNRPVEQPQLDLTPDLAPAA